MDPYKVVDKILVSHQNKDFDRVQSLFNEFVEIFNLQNLSLKLIRHHYSIAKALYYVLIDDFNAKISESERRKINLILYYCLLKGYLNSISRNNWHSEALGICKLATVFLTQNDMYLLSCLNFISNFSIKHIEDQKLFFISVINDAVSKNFNCSSDEVINDHYDCISNRLHKKLLTGVNMLNLTNTTPTEFTNISKAIELNFKM